ncbi:hypothetical protein DERF_014187 [Dermatophagoides farinae]|uniref:Uncharacterized protein n=1 Tax=Dermatophagoides farinae TaxID=6954 RepID=A0A922HH09_DERFA|nr:hypothetical protein DERF_014187 [Dermatophagoides farinae]
MILIPNGLSPLSVDNCLSDSNNTADLARNFWMLRNSFCLAPLVILRCSKSCSVIFIISSYDIWANIDAYLCRQFSPHTKSESELIINSCDI